MEHNIGHLKKGDVVYVPFPLNDLEEKQETPQLNQCDSKEGQEETASPRIGDPRKKKDRTALILWQAGTDSFTVCAITSKPYREHTIQLSGRDLDSGKINNEPSFIRPNIITTLPRKYIRIKVGALKPHKLREVTEKVKEFLDREPEEAPVSKVFQRAKKRIR